MILSVAWSVSNQSTFAYLPASGYAQSLTLFTARSFVDPQGEVLGTLIASASSPLPYTLLDSSRSFLPGAAGYFFTSESELVGSQPTARAAANHPQRRALRPLEFHQRQSAP